MLSTPIIASVFGLIFVAELPDKSAIASLVLSTNTALAGCSPESPRPSPCTRCSPSPPGPLASAIRIDHFVVPCSHPAIGTDRPDTGARSMESRAWNKTNRATAARAAMPSAQALGVFFEYAPYSGVVARSERPRRVPRSLPRHGTAFPLLNVLDRTPP